MDALTLVFVAAVVAVIALGLFLLTRRRRPSVRDDPNATASITINVRGANSGSKRPAEYDEDETI